MLEEGGCPVRDPSRNHCSPVVFLREVQQMFGWELGVRGPDLLLPFLVSITVYPSMPQPGIRAPDIENLRYTSLPVFKAVCLGCTLACLVLQVCVVRALLVSCLRKLALYPYKRVHHTPD